jgi:hypothetical protein
MRDYVEQTILKKLVKKDLLQQIWLKTDRLVSQSGNNRKKFGENLTGHHSWYSDATNNYEDVRISSFARVLGLLHKESNIDNVELASIFSKEVLARAELLTYLSSTSEEEEYVREIIKDKRIIFSDIRGSLDNLYRQDKLGDADLNQGYTELGHILAELERESDG